jgi:hypothetical protein
VDEFYRAGRPLREDKTAAPSPTPQGEASVREP